MKLRSLINKGVETVSVLYPEREAKEMVFAYMEDVFGIMRHKHVLEPDYALSEAEVLRAEEDFEKMAGGQPLQYVTGKAYFYGREFRVTPDVLIPRQETELLCREVLTSCKPQSRILDLCTGSGCIAWTMALEMPASSVIAVDISEGALSVASSQDFEYEMHLIGAQAPVFVKKDVLLGPASFIQDRGAGKYDVIISNPPYVMDSEKAQMRTNVLDHEPHLALFVPDDDPLRFYVAVARWAVELLAAGGAGIVEINEALGAETARFFEDYGFSDVKVIKDLHEKDRFVKFIRK